jgi:FkbM family methyltransferase
MKFALLNLLYKILGFENYIHIANILKYKLIRHDKRKALYFHFLNKLKLDAQTLVVGANTGWSTIPIAEKTPQGKVFAFEPIPVNFTALKKIVAYTKAANVQVFNSALGDKKGKVTMSMPVVQGVKSYGMSHLVDDKITYFEQGIPFEVEMQTLDTMVQTWGGKLDAVKLVAENSEQYIIKGGWHTFSKQKPLIYCEFWDNENRHECLNIFLSLGYQIMILQNNQLTPYPGKSYTERPFLLIPPQMN